LGRLLTFTCICLILFLGISVFFRVGEIQVEGDTRYTSEQIIAAAGLDGGAHMLFISANVIQDNIRREMAFANQVEVRRRWPATLEITVTDKVPVAFVRAERGYLILDSKCQVMEIRERPDLPGLVPIEGISPILPVVGTVIALGEIGHGKVAYLQSLLPVIEDLGLADRLERIEIAHVNDVRLTYAGGRFEVLLGQNRDLDYKLAMLLGTVERLGDYEQGIIDLSRGDAAHFRPT